MTTPIIVINDSGSPVMVLVSKINDGKGSSDWYTLAKESRDQWSRPGWEVVAFKNEDDSNRVGVYVKPGSIVTFKGFKEDIVSQ